MKPKTVDRKLIIGGKIGENAFDSESIMCAKKYLIEPKNFWKASKTLMSTFFSVSSSFCTDKASVNKNKNMFFKNEATFS